MTLLITMLAAVVSTAVWYSNEKARALKCGALCYMYWGASLMWFVDAVAEYLESGAEYFTPAPLDMLNDAFLGLSAVVLGAVIWTAYVLMKDPMGVLKKSFSAKK